MQAERAKAQAKYRKQGTRIDQLGYIVTKLRGKKAQAAETPALISSDASPAITPLSSPNTKPGQPLKENHKNLKIKLGSSCS
jgi:hypothetical protein